MRYLGQKTRAQLKMLAVISSTQTDMRSPKNKRREPRVSAGMTYWEPLELQLSNMEIQPQHNTKKKHLTLVYSQQLFHRAADWSHFVTHLRARLSGSGEFPLPPSSSKRDWQESSAPFLSRYIYAESAARPRSPEASGFHLRADK